MRGFVTATSLFIFAQLCLLVSSQAITPNTDGQLEKRQSVVLWNSATCTALGIGCNYQLDPLNCGARYHICPTIYSNGIGASCVAGVCTPLTCNLGYVLFGSSCTAVNTQTDVNNCGTIGNVCAAGFANGSGSVCRAGLCQPATCNAGFGLNLLGVVGLCVSLNTVNNCGGVGIACNIANGIGSCASGTCTIASCNSGFYNVGGVCTSLNLQTDVNNCGAAGTKCSTLLQYGTSTCVSGVCKYSTCNTGYSLVGGVCIAVNTQTDSNNCGTFGNVCSSSFANGIGSVCKLGVCQPTACNSGYGLSFLSGVGTCVSTNSLTNCGGIGVACSVPNGVASCATGTCTLVSCNSGYYNVNGVCTSLNLQQDINNCGSIGNKCTFTNGAGSCVAGSCTYTSCVSPYLLSGNKCTAVDLQTDPNHCGSMTTVCPSSYVNGGAGSCVKGVCQTTCSSGYIFDTIYGYCRSVTSDINNCGAIGLVCAVTGALGTSCVNGKCVATACLTGFSLSNGVCSLINLATDILNCGVLGHSCSFTSPSTATGKCIAGICTITSCGNSQYTIINNVCVKTSASQRARLAKRDKAPVKRTLCPEGETACPIAGSASYESAVTQHFSGTNEFAGVMAGAGGYECLDTKQSLESCGGCASTGEGQDCTKIRGAVGVGCDGGACVVFSCLPGWSPNLAGTRCVRAHPVHSNVEGNHSDTTSARRHLHARGHSHRHL